MTPPQRRSSGRAWQRARALSVLAGLCLATSWGLMRVPPTHDAPARHAPSALRTHNAEVASLSGVDRLEAEGYDVDGTGVLLGDWDDGHPRGTHEALRGRVRVRDVAGISQHATHTVTTAIGAGDGMARGARVWASDWLLDAAELEAAAPALALSNHPYGITMGWADTPSCSDSPTWWGQPGEREDARFGKYLPVASELDGVIHRTGVPSFWPAGNERNDRGVAPGQAHAHAGACEQLHRDVHLQEVTLQYDTLGGQALAKNVITVAAARDAPADASGARLWPVDISAFGPTDDGRIKPELAMGGEAVRSAVLGADDAYATFEGTSSAVSAASGLAALVVQAYREQRAADLDAAAMRALLVHSTREAGAAPGPDYRLGYGVVDAGLALGRVVDDGDAGAAMRHIVVAALGPGEQLELPTARDAMQGEALRVVLAWSDPPAPANLAGLDDAAPTLVHDLDLELVAPDGRAFHPWSLDPQQPQRAATRAGANHRDNLEVVDVDGRDVSDAGRWTVRVRAPGALQRARPQALALVSSVPLSLPDQPLLQMRRGVEWTVGDGALSVPVGDAGNGQLQWSASTAHPALVLTTASGGPGDALVIEVDAAQVGSEELLATVRVDSNDPRGPATLGVVLRAGCEPDCDGRACGLDPRCGVLCGRCDDGEYCDAGACAELESGSCPAGDLGSDVGAGLVAARLARAAGAPGGSCGSGGAATPLAWSAPADGRYVVTTRGSAGDTLVSVHAGACDSGEELACNDDSGGASSSLVFDASAGQPLTLVVEDAKGDAASEFALGVLRSRCPDVELGSRLGSGRVRATTHGGVDHGRGACGGQDTEDVAFGWQAPADGRYAFKLFGPRYQAVLYVRDGDCDGRELGCSPAPDVGPVMLRLSQGQRVVVVVDGRAGTSGEFELDIQATDVLCAGACAEGPADGSCRCDAACVERGDCCIDACEACGACRCERSCIGRSCGDDGCGGSCGGCAAGLRCQAGRCQADPCAGVECDACSQCVEGDCQALLEGAPCEDGDLCTVLDACEDGECVGQARDCDDGVACTVDRCDGRSGRCVAEPSEACERCDGDGDCPHTLVDAGDSRADEDASVADGGDPGHDAGADAGGDRAGDGGGCGCRTAASSHVPHAGMSGLFLLLALRLRRRVAAMGGRNGSGRVKMPLSEP